MWTAHIKSDCITVFNKAGRYFKNNDINIGNGEMRSCSHEIKLWIRTVGVGHMTDYVINFERNFMTKKGSIILVKRINIC